MLSILDGHCRYAHVGALRVEGVATHILGMNKGISDDSLRRALGAIAPEPLARHSQEQRQAQQAQAARAVQWMQQHLRRSVDAALYTPWILDCDTTIKDQRTDASAHSCPTQLRTAVSRPSSQIPA